jgi:hypothetical protein
VDFDNMLISSNQTLSSQENIDGVSTTSSAPNWYPFPPGACPPLYYIILQGVCAPLIIIISIVLNSLIAVVLLQKHLRSPTNILLLAIAFYDTLTGLFPFPGYIYVFTFRKCDDYMPYNYGWFHRITYEVLPFIFHTCSIWVSQGRAREMLSCGGDRRHTLIAIVCCRCEAHHYSSRSNPILLEFK